MPVNLTETAINAAVKKAGEAAKRLELIDKGHAGLRLRVTPSGSKAWVLACRDPLGRMRRFPLGNHPQIGIADARNAARAMWASVRTGIDPIEDARRKRAIGRDAREGVGTLEALIELYGKKRGANLKSWAECERRIKSVFKHLLRRPIATMKPGDLQLEADKWPSGQSAAAAVRYLRPILKWAAEGGRGYVTVDLANLSPPATVRRRDRVISRDELSQILPALRTSNRPYAAAMRFLLYTLARREEACSAKWRDIDFTAKTWTIEETKNRQPHIVPLSHQAVALLKSLCPKDRERQTVHPKPSAFIFSTSTGAAIENWDRETKAIQKDSKTTSWNRHDLRRTGATLLGDMGHPPHVIEAALNHVSVHSQLAATYNRTRYRPEVATALQRLADALDGIEQGAAEVFRLHQATLS